VKNLEDTKHGLILIGSGFLTAIGLSLGIYGILVFKTGLFVAEMYGPVFALITAVVIIGVIIALCYGASEDEWKVAGWAYLILIIILGIIGIFLAVIM